MKRVQQLINIYENLFTVGSLRRNIILYLITYVIYSIIILFYCYLTLNYTIFAVYIIYPLLNLLLTLLYLKAVLPERDNKFYCIRRLLALYSVENAAMVMLALLILPLTYYISNTETALPAIIIGSITIDIIVLGATLYNGITHSNIISATKILIFSTIVYSYIPLNLTTCILLTSYASSFLLSNFTLYLIKKFSKKYVAEDIFELLRGYIDSWLLNDPRKLDTILYKNSIGHEVKIDLILFPDVSRRRLYIVVPYFHFGPFKNVGSSSFPAYVSKELYIKNGLLTVVFHGPSTHSEDLASNKDVENIVKKITEVDSQYRFNKVSDIYSINIGEAVAKYMRLGNVLLLFLEYSMMEDLPLDIVETFKNFGKKLGFDDVIVVDSHNSLIDKKYTMDDKAISSILSVGISAIEEAKNIEPHIFKYSVEKVELPNIGIKEGLGSNGISIIIFETPLKRNCIISIDSNNLHPDLKKAIEKSIVNNYVDTLVVTTTDTHEVTAHEVIEGGYKVLGESKNIRDEILEAIEKGVKNALTRLKSGEGYIYSHKIPVHVIGDNLIEKLSAMTINTRNYTLKILKYYVAPLIIALTFLINLMCMIL